MPSDAHLLSPATIGLHPVGMLAIDDPPHAVGRKDLNPTLYAVGISLVVQPGVSDVDHRGILIEPHDFSVWR